MSYQAQTFVGDMRGCSRGEKAVLNVLARYHDHRSGICRVSQDQIALEAEMSERHVITLCQAMEARHVIERLREHRGRGAITQWHLAGMQKGEVASPFLASERVKFVARKGEIHAGKGEVASPHNKERKKNQEIQVRTLPNPPLQGGNATRLLTARETKTLNERIAVIQRSHLDQFGHQRYDDLNNPIPALDFAEALEASCRQLMLPVESARMAAEAAGLGRKKDPQSAKASA